MLVSQLLSRVRAGAYLSSLLWSVLLFILCIVRLSYTTHRRNETSLFNGEPFYDPSVAELLFSSLVTNLWIPFLLYSVHRRVEHVFLTRVWFECLMLGILWLFWLGGAAAATSVWPNLSFCVQFEQCRTLQALMAFAWLGWISFTVLIGVTGVLTLSSLSSSAVNATEGRWSRHVHVERASSSSVVTRDVAGGQPEMYTFAAGSSTSQTPLGVSFRFPPHLPGSTSESAV